MIKIIQNIFCHAKDSTVEFSNFQPIKVLGIYFIVLAKFKRFSIIFLENI